jgi:preprotein translocase subunit YajC
MKHDEVPNKLPIRKNDEVAIYGDNRKKGTVERVWEESGYAVVDCGHSSRYTGFWYFESLIIVDEKIRSIREKELRRKSGFEEAKPLTDVEIGDLIVTSQGETVVVKSVSARQVKAGGLKFTKSSGEGWGDQTISAQPKPKEEPEAVRDLDEIKPGDTVEISNGEFEEVTKVSTRQIRTESHKFKRSDGTGWADETAFIVLG